jgi:hypothetical protein
MEAEEYRPLVAAGADGLIVYQETYDRDAYAAYHTAGPKKDFDWRLACPERGAAAGFRRLGLGALFGLSDWRRLGWCIAATATTGGKGEAQGGGEDMAGHVVGSLFGAISVIRNQANRQAICQHTIRRRGR